MILLLSALKLNTFHLRAILLLWLSFFLSFFLLLLAIYSEAPLILLYAFSIYSGDMGPKLALCRHQGPRPRTSLKPTSELGLKCLYILAGRSIRKIKKRRWITFAMEISWNNENYMLGISWICVELALVQFASEEVTSGSALVGNLFNGASDVVLEYRGMLAGSSSTPTNGQGNW